MGMILIIMFVVLTLLLLLLTFRQRLKHLAISMRRYRVGRIAIFGLKVLPVVGFFVAYNYIAPYITPYELPRSQQPKMKVLSEGEYFMGIRSHFILPHDHSYGDLLIPKGSLIHRWGGRSSSGGRIVLWDWIILILYDSHILLKLPEWKRWLYGEVR